MRRRERIAFARSKVVGLEEEQRCPGFAPVAPRSSVALVVGQELHDRRLPLAVVVDPDPAEALRAELLADELLEPIDLAARQLVRVVDRQALHDAAGVHHAAEGLEAALRKERP